MRIPLNEWRALRGLHSVLLRAFLAALVRALRWKAEGRKLIRMEVAGDDRIEPWEVPGSCSCSGWMSNEREAAHVESLIEK